jgi:hypothetical protein
MSKNDDALRSEVNSLIRDEIQTLINEYIDTQDALGGNASGLGFVDNTDDEQLKVKIRKDAVNQIIKEYKKIKKVEKSNLGQIKKMGLVDKFGKPLT